MEFVGGTAMYVDFLVAGGTINLTSKFTMINFNTSAEDVETTAGNEVWKKMLPGDASWSVSYEGWYDDANAALGTADMNKLQPRVTGVVRIGPLGTVTGKPRYGGSVIIRTADTDFSRNEPVKVSLEFGGVGQPYWTHGSAW